MDLYSINSNDVGITVIGGTTGLGQITEKELDAKMEEIRSLSRNNKTRMIDEFWNAHNSSAVNQLHADHPPFKLGSAK